jgi:hypothetical protein
MKKRAVFFALVFIKLFSVTKSALACKGSQVLFQDNFSTLDPSWGNPSQDLSVGDGKLVVQLGVYAFGILNQANLKIADDAATPIAITAPPASNTASGCNGNRVLYQDNFVTLDPAWGVPSPNLNVNNGKLVMQPEINNEVLALNQANLFQDMNFCVKVVLVKSDDPSYSAGPVFWAKDPGDYYYVLVCGNGQFAVKRWFNSRILTPVTWRESAAINKSIGQTNQIQLVTKGNQATVYINGTEVITFNGLSPQGGGFIGLVSYSPEKAQNKNVWEFSDFKVTK